MQVIPLGTNGFFSSFGRQTMCFAIRCGTSLILLDAGSGVFRFAEPEGKQLLDGVTHIHIFLSHYHLDHTMGFYAAFKLFEGKHVTVYGKTNKRIFEEFITMEYTPPSYPHEYLQYQWKEIDHIELECCSVTTRIQSHNNTGSLAFRLTFAEKKSICYVTDSEPCEESIQFCKSAMLLLHEHYQIGNDQYVKYPHDITKQFYHGHTTTIGASHIAKRAQVKELALIHHHPYFTKEALLSTLQYARSVYAPCHLAIDLTPLSL